MLSPDDLSLPHAAHFYRALMAVEADLPIADFLETHFADPHYDELRRSITRTVEGYDAADPHRISTFALRDEWMARDDGEHGRIAEGYGALIDFLAAECRRHGAVIRLGAPVAAIERRGGRIVARCRDGAIFEADAAILTVPLPLLSRDRAAAGGARAGRGRRRYRLRQRRQNPAALRNDMVGRSRRTGSLRPVVPLFRRDGPDLVDAASGRLSGADRLVRGTKADRVASLTASRARRDGPRLARRDLRSAGGPHQRGTSSPRGRSTGATTRSRAAPIPTTPKTRAALAILKGRATGDLLLFRRGALRGPGHGAAVRGGR